MRGLPLPQATVLLFEPNPGDPDNAWFVDAPSLTAWLQAWLDGTGWYDSLNDDLEPTPWTEFRIRTAANGATKP